LHSALTNTVTRAWLEGVRARARGGGGASGGASSAPEHAPSDPFGGDEVATLSFLEPHKRFQNSVAVLQKRPAGWGEPVHTTYP
jgi:hypothetical protein